MATIDLGKIKIVWRGTYAGGTAYTVDDAVEHTDSGITSSFICTTASTGNAPSTGGSVHGSWAYLAKGAAGSVLTTQGDILFRDGSGDQRLAKGTAGQALTMNSGATAPEWGTISSGTYSVHKVDSYNYQTAATFSSKDNYRDISGGNYVSFQPTHADDKIWIAHTCSVQHSSNDSGMDIYMMMNAGSSSITSSDTKLNYDGNHAIYSGGGGNEYEVQSKQFIIPCTSLSTSTVYYLEQAGASHNNNSVTFNISSTDDAGDYKNHQVSLIHYKKN